MIAMNLPKKKQKFIIQNLGFITPTNERKINYNEALKFEQIHKDTYKKFGFHCIYIEPKPIKERANDILKLIK